jgi:DNA-binding NarL/FixJ family response regulator
LALAGRLGGTPATPSKGGEAIIRQGARTKRASGQAGPARLTPREGDVLRLVVEGRTDSEIAQELGLQRRSVSARVSDLLRKYDLNSRTDLAVYAVRHRLV